MLSDSRAKALVISEQLLPQFAPLLPNLPFLKHVIVSGAGASGHKALKECSRRLTPALARADDLRRSVLLAVFLRLDRDAEGRRTRAFEHDRHRGSLRERRARRHRERRAFFRGEIVFCIRLGNAQTFALAIGATAVLMAERATPASVFKRLAERKPTIFYAVRHFTARCSPVPSSEMGVPHAAPVRLGRRGLAGRHGQALEREDRRRHPGGHRLDRDASHVHQLPAGGCALWRDREARARVRAAPGGRAGSPGRRGRSASSR